MCRQQVPSRLSALPRTRSAQASTEQLQAPQGSRALPRRMPSARPLPPLPITCRAGPPPAAARGGSPPPAPSRSWTWRSAGWRPSPSARPGPARTPLSRAPRAGSAGRGAAGCPRAAPRSARPCVRRGQGERGRPRGARGACPTARMFHAARVTPTAPPHGQQHPLLCPAQPSQRCVQEPHSLLQELLQPLSPLLDKFIRAAHKEGGFPRQLWDGPAGRKVPQLRVRAQRWDTAGSSWRPGLQGPVSVSGESPPQVHGTEGGAGSSGLTPGQHSSGAAAAATRTHGTGAAHMRSWQ